MLDMFQKEVEFEVRSKKEVALKLDGTLVLTGTLRQMLELEYPAEIKSMFIAQVITSLDQKSLMSALSKNAEAKKKAKAGKVKTVTEIPTIEQQSE